MRTDEVMRSLRRNRACTLAAAWVVAPTARAQCPTEPRGAYYSHFANVCTMGGSTSAIVAPDAFDRYYFVVPNDGQNEGSYGRDSTDNERPPGGAACEAPQNIGCP